jgi:hypothetical protein
MPVVVWPAHFRGRLHACSAELHRTLGDGYALSMQPGDVARDRWTLLVAMTADERAVFVRKWAVSEDPATTLESAQCECDSRVQYWIAELSLRLDIRTASARIARAGRRAHHWAVYVVLWAAFAGVVLVQGGIATMVALSLVVALGVLVTIAARRSHRRYFWNYWRALEMGFCPGCGYDLSGLSHLESRGSTLRDVGPERCPECGAPWPLVPPPVPTKDATR